MEKPRSTENAGHQQLEGQRTDRTELQKDLILPTLTLDVPQAGLWEGDPLPVLPFCGTWVASPRKVTQARKGKS
jgi:hypothetical protein